MAATNTKQRTRKQIEYYHADRLNHTVAGTPNRLEYDQGFFVKNGDGAWTAAPCGIKLASDPTLARQMISVSPDCNTDLRCQQSAGGVSRVVQLCAADPAAPWSWAT